MRDDDAGRRDGGGDADGEVSTVEVYGFVGFMSSIVAYVLYLAWAYVPASTLRAFGITYYPSKYWAVALPAWAAVTVAAAWWLYEGINMMGAPAPEDVAWPAGGRAPGDAAAFFSAAADQIPPLVEVPPGLASALLYGGRHPLAGGPGPGPPAPARRRGGAAPEPG